MISNELSYEGIFIFGSFSLSSFEFAIRTSIDISIDLANCDTFLVNYSAMHNRKIILNQNIDYFICFFRMLREKYKKTH